MSHLKNDEKRQVNDVLNKCPQEIRDAYNSVDGFRSFTVEVPHDDLMNDMKVLVEAISNAKDFDKSVGAILLTALLQIYEKAGNPIK
jgi:hypothetical protein